MFWVSMVKYGCCQSVHWTQQWTGGIKSFFILEQIQESEKLIQLLVGHGQKWPLLFRSWETKICSTIRMNLWIELIFWMLIVMQEFLVRLIPYSLTFKWWGSTAVVLLVSFYIWFCNCYIFKLLANTLNILWLWLHDNGVFMSIRLFCPF